MTDTIPEQLQRRREAAGRCEPLDCGHRDPLDCIDVCSAPNGDEKGIHSVETPGGDPRAQWQRERARREITLASIRGHLAEQPSPRAVRSCARLWCNDLTNLAETVIKAMNNTEDTA